ncbi:MAG: hypothetical protein ACRDJV_00985 [Actinomycetota bacterium]
MGLVTNSIKSVSLRVSGVIGPHPTIYLPLARVKHRWDIRGTELNGMRPNLDAAPPPVGRGVEIVIEGFPRSANTFAVAAFRMAQDRFVHIAHHRHVSAQVIGGVHMKIPVLVLIRDPREVVLSLVVREPAISLDLALRNYIRFYRPILELRNHFVCADFNQVTTNFGSVVRGVNDRFGTTFGVFEHTPENVRECFAEIEANHRRRGEGTDIRKLTIPSSERMQLKRQQQNDFLSSRLSGLRERAYALYSSFQ